MIVQTMNFKEIHNELLRDYDNCKDIFEKEKKRIRRAVIKSNKFPMRFNPIEFTTTRNNRYIIILQANSKKLERDLDFSLVSIFLKGGGLFAVSILKDDIGNTHSLIFTPHFFIRYQERIIGQTVGAINAIRLFFNQNSFFSGEEDEDKKFQGRCDEGYLFGESIEYNIRLVKTIISKKMMRGEQIILSKTIDQRLTA